MIGKTPYSHPDLHPTTIGKNFVTLSLESSVGLILAQWTPKYVKGPDMNSKSRILNKIAPSYCRNAMGFPGVTHILRNTNCNALSDICDPADSQSIKQSRVVYVNSPVHVTRT